MPSPSCQWTVGATAESISGAQTPGRLNERMARTWTSLHVHVCMDAHPSIKSKHTVAVTMRAVGVCPRASRVHELTRQARTIDISRSARLTSLRRIGGPLADHAHKERGRPSAQPRTLSADGLTRTRGGARWAPTQTKQKSRQENTTAPTSPPSTTSRAPPCAQTNTQMHGPPPP